MITSPITVSAQKAVNLDCDEMLIWGCVGKQTMVSGASDPVYFYFKIDTETYGTGLIKKTSEDGVVSGIKFNISGNGVNQTVVTKADGTVDISLMPGVYTVTEQPIDRYADYLESVSAPQYEVDAQRKMVRQRFIDAHRDLPSADKRDTLALRLSDFIRDLDGYEKDLLIQMLLHRRCAYQDKAQAPAQRNLKPLPRLTVCRSDRRC